MRRCVVKNMNGNSVVVDEVCKGYGFIMFTTFEQANAAISFLNQEGYRASFAKASISSKLRGLQDNYSCNLYFANIPQEFDEAMLGEYLRDQFGVEIGDPVIESVRILRSEDGQSKKVGFARFSYREAAELIISKLHGTVFEGATKPIQVRFTVNIAQKMLKAGSRNLHYGHSYASSSSSSVSNCRFYDPVTSQSDYFDSNSSVGRGF